MAARILVVDDEPDLEVLVRQKFRRQVRDGVYDFSFARDGIEALSTLDDDPDIDLVLTDINMPRMDGLTLLEKLRALSGQTRAVVIVSAYGDMSNIRTAMNRGAFDFVTKPIDFKDLEVTITRTVDELQAYRELKRQGAEAERARANLARYFSPNLADHLAEHPDTLKLGGERRELTFLFTDLAGFTPLVERLAPTTVVSVMNDYIGGLAGVVFAHGGTVDTVVGDAVHAMFGAPLEQTDHAARAVACALAIDAFAQAFAARMAADDVALGVTRIGVHTGSAIVGNFGGEGYFHYTAHGDTVNTAARLETANKVLGTRICVSGVTVAAIPHFVGRPIGNLVLKGKTDETPAFEPLAPEAAGSERLEAYLAAFEKLTAGDPGGVQTFAAYVGAHADDPLASFHLKRLLAGETGARIVVSGT